MTKEGKNKNIKRVSLYFNLDNDFDKELWDYLEETYSKTATLKEALKGKKDGVVTVKAAAPSENIFNDEEDIINDPDLGFQVII